MTVWHDLLGTWGGLLSAFALVFSAFAIPAGVLYALHREIKGAAELRADALGRDKGQAEPRA